MQVTTPINEGISVNRRAVGAVLIAVALAVITAVALAMVASPAPETAIETDLTSGFEYQTDATAGRTASAGVTGQYFGNSGELYPEVSVASVPKEATNEFYEWTEAPEWFGNPLVGATTQPGSEWSESPGSPR